MQTTEHQIETEIETLRETYPEFKNWFWNNSSDIEHMAETLKTDKGAIRFRALAKKMEEFENNPLHSSLNRVSYL